MFLAIPAFAAGIAFLQIQPDLPTPLTLFLLLLLQVALILPYKKTRNSLIKSICILLIGILAGFSWAALFAHYRLSDTLPQVWQSQDIQITGVIAQLPQRFEYGQRFVFDVQSVQTPGARVPSTILLSWYDNSRSSAVAAQPGIKPGERWILTVRLKRPHGNVNPFGFDYEAWLLERGIRATGYVRTGPENLKLDPLVPHPAYLIQRLRDNIRDRFFAALPEHDYTGILTALAIGDQQAIPGDQWQIFNRTGTTHLMSISGLHITMIAALFSWLVNTLWRRSERLMVRCPAQKAAIICGWLAAFIYTLLSGFAIPAQRTLYMLSVVAIALCSGKNFGIGKVLLLSLLAVLLPDPWAVLSTGFWLSFGTIAILLLVGSRNASGQRGWHHVFVTWIIAQGAVTMLCIPLLLLFFQRFSLVSPLANAIAIPVISFLIAPLALLFSVLPSTLLIQVNHWLLSQLMSIMALLADWPVWQQPAPSIPMVSIALVGVLWLWMPAGFPSRFIGAFLMLPVLLWHPERPAAGEAWIDILDVGQGLSVVVRTHEHNLLYDTGPSYSNNSDAAQRVIVPYLLSANINHINMIVISHEDKDHSGGLHTLLTSLPTDLVISSMPAMPENIRTEHCLAGKKWVWDGIEFSFLYPDQSDYHIKKIKSNNLSCVLRVSNRNSSVLLTADIEASGEKKLLRRTQGELKSDVLLVPHHGGAGSSTSQFITAVDAPDVIFSVGYLNSFKHPHGKILERYRDSRQWRTDRDGAISIKLAATTHITGFRHKKRRYWHDL